MDIPSVKRRIAAFIAGEEGRISKQSLISMGAFLASGAAASFVTAQGPDIQPYTELTTTPAAADASCPSECPGTGVAPITHPDTDLEKNCDGKPNTPNQPACGCPFDKDGLEGHNAYTPDSNTPIIYGTGLCSDDDKWFHFNAGSLSYTEEGAAVEHRHHASHNSY
jgi:hypothetical protein